MHEFSLADDLLNLACDECLKAGIVRLDKITVRVGDLSGVCIDALEFACSFLRAENEITSQVEIMIERIPGKGICTKCGSEINLDRLFLYCPDCKTPTVEITEGREFLMVSLEGRDNCDGTEE